MSAPHFQKVELTQYQWRLVVSALWFRIAQLDNRREMSIEADDLHGLAINIMEQRALQPGPEQI